MNPLAFCMSTPCEDLDLTELSNEIFSWWATLPLWLQLIIVIGTIASMIYLGYSNQHDPDYKALDEWVRGHNDSKGT